MTRLFNHIRQDNFLSRLLVFASSDALSRVIRIGTTIIVARHIGPTALGIAALALTLHELVKILTNAGISQRLIAASKRDMPAMLNRAHHLFWALCLGLFLLNLGMAAVIFAAFQHVDVALMVASLGLVFLFMPAGLVQCALLMRENKTNVIARISMSQVAVDNILTAILVIIWPGAWAIILPKLLTAPLWLVMMRRAHSWRPAANGEMAPLKPFLSFGGRVMGSELLNGARQHGDKLIVSSLLGVDALGFYYFAFNAGLGLTMSLLNAFGIVLLPALCAVEKGRGRYQIFQTCLKQGGLVVLPLIAAQAALAPLYVPLIFGPTWAGASHLVAVQCMAAFPLFIAVTLSVWYRAHEQGENDLNLSAFNAVAVLSAVAIGASFHVLGAIIGFVVAATFINASAFALFLNTYSKLKEA